MGFLTDLIERLRRELNEHPLEDGALMARAMGRPPTKSLAAALREDPPAVIAEVKHASPSAGVIVEGDDLVDRARAYAEGGAAAISVLTEPRHFGGSIADLQAVRSVVDLPLLRKDFLVHPSQAIEARAYGADAILLIAAALSVAELTALCAAAKDLGMEPLVEAYSDDDLERALATDAEVVGVNARDLETLELDLDRALERLGRIPSDRVAVLESGMSTRAHVEAAMAAGASAILIGEALMRAPDPAAAVRALRGSGG